MRINILNIIIVLFSLNGCAWVEPANNKPNVIIVLTDDQGWGDVGFNGNKMIKTPTLDSLASNSVVFDRFYVSPVCAPTRASLLTGKYHLATGTSWVTHRKEVMRESEVTIAEILKSHGFKTGYFGKWHNGAQYPHNPNGQGFDIFFGFSAGHWNNYFDTQLEYNGNKVQTQGYIADVITDSVNSFIQNTQEPFFAYIAFNTPHTPYQVADEYYDKYTALDLDAQTSTIYGMCENIDDNISRIQKALQKAGKHDQTIFIFLSDNGPNYIRYNGGFKGRKAQVHEGGVRVPFFVNFPDGRYPSRRVENNFGTHIDILPTILDVCNIPNPKGDIDGISLLPVLTSPEYELSDRKFFSHHIMSEDAFCGAVRSNEYLLTCYPGDTNLYNLLNDPYQMKEISSSNKELVNALTKDYEQWLVGCTKKGLKPEPIYVGLQEGKSIDFPAHEASLYGHLKFAGGAGWANDWVTNFSNINDSMTWDIKEVGDAKYKMQVKYACNANAIGSNLKIGLGNRVVSNDILSAASAEVIPNRDRVKRVEVDERAWGILDFGTVDVLESDTIISLSYSGVGKDNFQVKELILSKIE